MFSVEKALINTQYSKQQTDKERGVLTEHLHFVINLFVPSFILRLAVTLVDSAVEHPRNSFSIVFVSTERL